MVETITFVANCVRSQFFLGGGQQLKKFPLWRSIYFFPLSCQPILFVFEISCSFS